MIPRPASSAVLPLLALLAFVLAPGSLRAQQVRGTVVGPDGPLDGATVRVEGRERAVTDEAGRFLLRDLPPGQAVLAVELLGYGTARRTVEVPSEGTVEVEIRLEEAAIPLDPLVVTGTLTETRVSESPVKVEVVGAPVLRRHASRSLMDAVDRIHGLQQQVDCGVCYTNSIRINGMEGPYTAVLIDGMPIQGALASVYGLNGIHPSLVERLEILKGPQSTLYGSEAMGGVVNVITKDARHAPRWALDLSRSDLGENEVAFSWAPGSGRSNTLVSGVVVHNDRFVDENGDGFSDLTMDTRATLFAKTAWLRDGERVGGLTGRYYYEDRFGGLEAWSEADRGSSEVYGESIRTHRAELMAEVELGGSLEARASWASHRQDSWYGDVSFDADQHIGFGQLLWDPPRGGSRHDLLAGAALRVTSYDDDTPATDEPEVELVPGLFLEDRFHADEAWTLLAGLRADHHRSHGVVVSPRGSVMFRPDHLTTLRLNAGTGFRTVHLFTEDHAALTGAREVVVEEALEPERSVSVALNLNRELFLESAPLMVDVDLFHTRFSNRILPDYDVDPDAIVYRNLEGETSVSRGVALSLNQNFRATPLTWTAGVTVQDVHVEDADGAREDDFFSPDYRGVWSVSYTVAGRVRVDWSGVVTGPMRLPEYPEPWSRPTRSERFAVHDLQGALLLGEGREVVLSVRNVGDFRQGSPLVAAHDPFGEAFDTNYVWGPVVGRRVTVAVRLAGSR